MPETTMNIYQKLAKIRKPVEILQKNKKGYGYTYVDEALILSKITGLMDKYGVSLIPNIVPGTLEVTPYRYTKTKSTKDGQIYEEHVNEIIVKADMEWIWVNDENPEERIVVPWIVAGQQSDVSQAFGSGLTYTARYFLLKYFNAATSDDDPDNWRSKQKEAEQEEDKLIAAGIVEKTHAVVTQYLESIKDDKQKAEERKKIIELTKKYVRENGKASSNYFSVTDPAVATALYDAITRELNKEGSNT